MTSRFTLVVHMLGMVAWSEAQRGEPATSEEMADSINTNPVVVRRLLGDLRRAGLVETKRGAGGGVWLQRPPEQITLRDVFEAVKEGEELFALHPNVPNQACLIGAHIEDFLQHVYGEAEEALKRRLELITIADANRQISARARTCPGTGRAVAAG